MLEKLERSAVIEAGSTAIEFIEAGAFDKYLEQIYQLFIFNLYNSLKI